MTRRRWLLAVVIVVAALVTILLNAPANWLARLAYNKTDGALVLSDASGTVWHGSAVVGLSGTLENPGAALALPGRLAWKLAGFGSRGLRFTLQGESLLTPVDADLGFYGVALSAGSAALPCELLDALGGALQTLQLRCQATIGWQTLSLPVSSTAQNGGTVTLLGLTSALSTIKPLGDYRIDWHQSTGSLTYQVTTARGPLAIAGQGQVPGSFSGTAQVQPGTAPDVADRLRSLLATLGPSGPSGTLLHY